MYKLQVYNLFLKFYKFNDSDIVYCIYYMYIKPQWLILFRSHTSAVNSQYALVLYTWNINES